MSDGENSLDLHGASQLTVSGNLIVGLVSNGVLRADEGSRIQVNGDAKIAYAGPPWAGVLLGRQHELEPDRRCSASASWARATSPSTRLPSSWSGKLEHRQVGRQWRAAARRRGLQRGGQVRQRGEQAEGSLLVNSGATARSSMAASTSAAARGGAAA